MPIPNYIVPAGIQANRSLRGRVAESQTVSCGDDAAKLTPLIGSPVTVLDMAEFYSPVECQRKVNECLHVAAMLTEEKKGVLGRPCPLFARSRRAGGPTAVVQPVRTESSSVTANRLRTAGL